MSHCTKFDFQYTNRKIICRTFETLGLDWQDSSLCEALKIGFIGIPLKTVAPMICAKKNGFQYFMVDKGAYYELLIEKHNMTPQEESISESMANEFKLSYIKEVAKEVVKQMNGKGENALLEETKNGYEIKFGQIYDKSILIKFNNGRVIEEVQGVKGKSCVSLTEALENMLSSPDVELQSEWTEEYYDEPDNGLTIYNMEEI